MTPPIKYSHCIIRFGFWEHPPWVLKAKSKAFVWGTPALAALALALATGPGRKANNRPYDFGLGLGFGLVRKAWPAGLGQRQITMIMVWLGLFKTSFTRPSIFYSWAETWPCRIKDFSGWGSKGWPWPWPWPWPRARRPITGPTNLASALALASAGRPIP